MRKISRRGLFGLGAAAAAMATIPGRAVAALSPALPARFDLLNGVLNLQPGDVFTIEGVAQKFVVKNMTSNRVELRMPSHFWGRRDAD